MVNTHTYTTVLLLCWNLSGTTRVSRYQKGKTNLDLLQQEIVSGSGICWAICKSAPRNQTTTPTSHHSVFYRPDALHAAQPTASKHWSSVCVYSSVNNLKSLAYTIPEIFSGLPLWKKFLRTANTFKFKDILKDKYKLLDASSVTKKMKNDQFNMNLRLQWPIMLIRTEYLMNGNIL